MDAPQTLAEKSAAKVASLLRQAQSWEWDATGEVARRRQTFPRRPVFQDDGNLYECADCPPNNAHPKSAFTKQGFVGWAGKRFCKPCLAKRFPHGKRTCMGCGRTRSTTSRTEKYVCLSCRQDAVSEALLTGVSVRAASRIARVTKYLAAQMHKKLESNRAILCRCGKRSNHKGWCRYRLRDSPDRQAVLQRMHSTQRKET